MKLSKFVLLSAAALVAAEHHNHFHLHHARHGSPIEGRSPAAVTQTVAGPVVTVYQLNGQDISYDDVEAGLKSGKYVIIGESISTVIPAPSSSTPTPTPSPSTTLEAAEFYQKPTSSSTSSPPPPPPPAATPASSGGSGINSNFPSGSIPCSSFPSSFGPIEVDWLGLGGWTGIQEVPNFDFGVDASISYIVTGVPGGGGCIAGSFCSYACPPGYQKSQWPSAQGATGQSIGGLYCNSDGMLELARPSVPQLCTSGVGNVQVTNSLSQNVAICRTDYPGTESETIPLNTEPGSTYQVTCPDASDYYVWQGSSTSAQYYINPQGAAVSDACQWGSAGTNLGNWAPINMGVGKGSAGGTYISLFPNAPTNPDGSLDFTITITGGISGDCKYSGGTFYSNGAESPNGCTVEVTGTATFEFS